MTIKIEYIKCGGSYQLTQTYSVQTHLRPVVKVVGSRFTLYPSGVLVIAEGYCWDGCSGPVLDRKTNMRAGLVHDALCEMSRRRLLSYKDWKSFAAEFGRILKEDGAWPLTIKIDLAGLYLAKEKYAHPRKRKLRYTAP